MKRLSLLLSVLVLSLSVALAPVSAATGWVSQNGNWYYYGQNGVKKTGWLQEGNNWYYLKADGSMKTGWYQEGKTWYYLGSSGAMKTGWVQAGSAWYYMDLKSGAMQTGWVKDGNSWYYMDKTSGAMKTGWVLDGGNWYFLNGNGSMKTGWLQDGGVWYYLYSNGVMAKNTVIEGYKLGSNGAWIETAASTFELSQEVIAEFERFGVVLETNSDGNIDYYYEGYHVGTIGDHILVAQYEYLDLTMAMVEVLTGKNVYWLTWSAEETEEPQTTTDGMVTVTPDFENMIVTYTWK